jgi:hypothetical protein
MEAGDHMLLKARQLEWNLGETTIALKDARVVLATHAINGVTSLITFSQDRDCINVMKDGVWEKSTNNVLICITADSGRLRFY